jgi:hypothetical protein
VLGNVAFEVKLRTFRNKTLATFLATAFDDVTASFRSHTGTEAVLLFTGAFRGLICAKAHGVVCGEI